MDGTIAVSVRDLVKVFPNPAGDELRAVDGISFDGFRHCGLHLQILQRGGLNLAKSRTNPAAWDLRRRDKSAL
ncbi:MAG: hypothetical protein ACRDIU_02925 [Actinomycetota bacterium]